MRLRQAKKRGAQVSLINSANDNLLFDLTGKLIVAPSQLVDSLAQVVKAVADIKGASCDLGVSVSDEARRIADSLISGTNAGVFLGNFAQQHEQAASLVALAQKLARYLGNQQCRIGFLAEAANSVGGYVAKALPMNGGRNIGQMLKDPRRAYLVLGAEPELDCADGVLALAAMRQADSVVVLSPFKSVAALEYADAILPVTPFSETSGTFISTEGRAQCFAAVARPQVEARPAWKVLRVLGNILQLAGFDYESSEAVRDERIADQAFVGGLDNRVVGDVETVLAANERHGGLERVADVPTYSADPLVRRATSLQRTKAAALPCARMNAEALSSIGVAAGQTVVLRNSSGGSITLEASLDAGVPDNCVRVAAGHPATANLGALNGTITVERGD